METNKKYYQDQVNKIVTTGEYKPTIKIFGQNGEGDTKHMDLNKDSAQVLIDWLQLIVNRETPRTIEFTRVNNDANGNPRYVCHFLEFISDKDEENHNLGKNKTDYNTAYKYVLALKRAKQLGGRKFHNKQFGGGIVFQSYNIKETERKILELINSL